MEKNKKSAKKTAPKQGRPPLAPENVRSKWLNDVRFSPAEIASLREKAAASGETWTAWVRGKLGLR